MMEELLSQTEEYLKYIKEHYINVQKAWKIIQDIGKGGPWDFLYDDSKYFILDLAIKEHDKSKLSDIEFNAYRGKFYPIEAEKNNRLLAGRAAYEFENAWSHHKLHNKHHWQNWTKSNWSNIDVVDNFCDWFAMSMKFEANPLDYYRKEKDRIILPENAIELMFDIENKIIAKA